MLDCTSDRDVKHNIYLYSMHSYPSFLSWYILISSDQHNFTKQIWSDGYNHYATEMLPAARGQCWAGNAIELGFAFTLPQVWTVRKNHRLFCFLAKVKQKEPSSLSYNSIPCDGFFSLYINIYLMSCQLQSFYQIQILGQTLIAYPS